MASNHATQSACTTRQRSPSLSISVAPLSPAFATAVLTTAVGVPDSF
jgi:hypothetical protein